MKFHGCVPLLALLVSLVCGCGTTSMGPSGVSPGLLITDANYPSAHDAQTRINFKRADIQILGVVKAEFESRNIFWLWASGDNGYGKLMQAARQSYPQADGVVDVQWDTEYRDLCACCGFCIFYRPVPLLATAVTHAEGKAFQFKR